MHEGKKSRKPGNSMNAKFYFAKVPTMSVVHKTRTVQKLSQKILLRDNSATSCHWEVFLMKWVWFFFHESHSCKIKSFCQIFCNWQSLLCEKTCVSQLWVFSFDNSKCGLYCRKFHLLLQQLALRALSVRVAFLIFRFFSNVFVRTLLQ